MNRKERAKIIQRELNNLFPEPAIPLDHHDPYTLLIATLLSAQCTDIRVNQVTPYLFKKGGSAEKMANIALEEIEEIIRPCGLTSRKAFAIKELSRILVELYEGKVPASFEALEALPGVGHKTASVVMAHAFDVPAFPVDTHIHRLAKRWKLSDGKNVKQVEYDLKKLFPKNEWIKLHLQIIYCGRTYCKAVKHHENKCPICSKLKKHIE